MAILKFGKNIEKALIRFFMCLRRVQGAKGKIFVHATANNEQTDMA